MFITREDLIERLMRNLHKIRSMPGYLGLHANPKTKLDHWYAIGPVRDYQFSGKTERDEEVFFDVRINNAKVHQEVEIMMEEICYELVIPYRKLESYRG